VAYAFKDTTLLVGNDVELVTGVLARMSGAQLPSLADDSDRAEAIRTIGGGGDLYGCVSAKRIVDIIKAAAPQEEKQKVERLIGALGFDNVSSAAMTLEIAPDESTQLRVKGVLAVRGPKRGIIAMLTPITATTASSLTSRPGLVSFFSANYDLGKMYDQMLQIMQAAGGPPIDMQVQMMMAMTAVNDTAGRPPVNFRQEVLGQLGYPVVVTTHLSKPYTDPGSSKIMFSLAARQAGVLDTTMSRIHWAMSRGNKDLRRELLGSTIYVVPPFMSDPSSPKIGFTVAGGRFVVGGIEGVEQAIRDLRREDLQTIQADPMYRYAAGHLPSQAGAWWYENKQIAAEAQWVQIKQAARKSAAESGDDEDQDNKEIAVGIGASFGSGIIAMTPMGQFLEAMKRYCDFSQLPDFDSVRKYFGASIGYVKETDSGIYLEAIELKSPPSQEVNAER